VVFIGLSASGAGDQFVPPVGGRGRPVPGVLLHASIAAAVLSGGLLWVSPPWLTLVAALALALVLQLIRTRAGRLPWTPLVLMPVVVLAGSVAMLWWVRCLVPVVTVVSAVVLSAIVREILESREAQRETDAVLHSLIRKHGSVALPPVPSGVGGRLQLVRDLEERLDLRRREMQRLVSHELKTPLASISGFGSMLETYQLSDDELHRVAGMIRNEADRLGDMVRTFLDLERLGSGVDELRREPLDLGDLVRSRCALLERVAYDRGQRLELEIASGVRVSGAPQLLERLTDNLVGNALKYSPDGEVIEVAVRRRDGWAVVEITDHGPGIPGESIPHLFERFYRQPGQTAPGSGLGLAVVKEFADWHGATVEVDSTVGRGSTFTVRLPAA
jgi:signal transduction histidine kinase